MRKIAYHVKGGDYKNVEVLYPSKFFGMEVAAAWFMTDQVDSVHLVLDDQGKTKSRVEYLPYGETFVQKGDKDFLPKYNSQELDKETGFYFYNARYYDPEISRFTIADSVIDGEFDTQGWNRFAYVKGNPIIGKDPTGHEAKKWEIKLGEMGELGAAAGFWIDNFNAKEFINGVVVDTVVGIAKTAVATVKFASNSKYREDIVSSTKDEVKTIIKKKQKGKMHAYISKKYGGAIERSFDDNPSRFLGNMAAMGIGGVKGTKLIRGIPGKTTSVTRCGRPGLRSTDWVMKGGKTLTNYSLSGKWQPTWMPGKNKPASFKSGETYQVPKSCLKWPTGSGLDGIMKGPLGQRKYIGPDR